MRRGMIPPLDSTLGRRRRRHVRFHSHSRVLAGSPRKRTRIGTHNLDGRDGDVVSDVDVLRCKSLPKHMLVMQLNIYWSTTKAQTTGERPRSRAKWFMTGNRTNRGMKQDTPVIKTLFNPRRRMIFARNSPWNVPQTSPKVPRHNPILAGDKPSPPRWMGVAKKRGWRAQYAMSMKETQR